MLDINGKLRLKLCKEIADSIPCDLFTATRIVNNLWSAYEKAFAKDPAIEEDVLKGDFTLEPRS